MRFLKKIALAILAVAVALPAFAERISKERAAEVAAAFFSDAAKRGPSPGLSQVKGAGDSFVAFNRDGGGFVVIALNDAAPPILAYSYTGRFPSKDEMPENMAWWFSQVDSQIKAIGVTAKQSEEVRSRWKNPAPILTKAGSKLYETASWNQNEPFNNLCPMDGDERCVTGCVAIAGAILARYFQWPDAGEGTVPEKPGYCYGPEYPAHDLGYSYDWANMPLSYRNGYNDTQAEAVATLVYDMATIAQMSFGVDGSSANTGILISGLKTYMKYDKGASLVDRSDYTDSQWSQLLTDIIDDYGPTLYSARTPQNAGHTFIMDGYDSEGRFHFNWGWAWYDCYCEIGSIVPTGTPYVFSESQQVAVGLVPDYDGTSTGRDLLVFVKANDVAGISADTDTFEKDVPFMGSTGYIGPKVNNFAGSVYLSLYDKDGNLKQDISKVWDTTISLGAFRSTTRTCCITCDIAPGDRIRVRYVGQYNAGIINSGGGCVTEIIVMEESGGGEEPDPTAGYTAAQTAASTSLSYDKATGRLTLTFANPANWAVKTSGGDTVASGTAATGGDVVIDTSAYASGVYTILAGSTEDPFSFTITK